MDSDLDNDSMKKRLITPSKSFNDMKTPNNERSNDNSYNSFKIHQTT